MTLEGPVRSSWFNSEVVTKFGQESEKSFWNAQWRGRNDVYRKVPKTFFDHRQQGSDGCRYEWRRQKIGFQLASKIVCLGGKPC